MTEDHRTEKSAMDLEERQLSNCSKDFAFASPTVDQEGAN